MVTSAQMPAAWHSGLLLTIQGWGSGISSVPRRTSLKHVGAVRVTGETDTFHSSPAPWSFLQADSMCLIASRTTSPSVLTGHLSWTLRLSPFTTSLSTPSFISRPLSCDGSISSLKINLASQMHLIFSFL